jgi:hypothetical protein
MMKLQKTLYGLLAVLILMAGFSGCERTTDDEEAEFPSDGEVFMDDFGSGVGFEAFANSYYAALDIDNQESYQGTSSLVITVPEEDSDLGWFAGGTFTHDVGRDLTEFNALTFWAKASTDITINELGIGNDNTGTSLYVAQITGTPVTTSWTKIIIPVPLPSRLVEERGLFYFSEGHEDGLGCMMWFDEVQFEELDTILDPRPAIVTQTVNTGVGGTVAVEGSTVTFAVNGTDQLVEADPGYFTFISSDETVLTVDGTGVITAISEGTAAITARLGDIDATGVLTVVVGVPSDGPTTPAPVPTQVEEDVISLYSNAYTDVTVDTWSADWDMADLADVQIVGDDAKLYTNLSYAGIEFSSAPIDASAMTHFSMDIWTPDPTEAPAAFKIKLVDFGADGAYQGGDDVEHELTFSAATDPALQTETWVSFDIQLSSFVGLVNREHLAQLIISSADNALPNTVYVDNIYFFAGEVTQPDEPETAATVPTFDPGNVISLFSDVYDDHPVDTWSPDWDVADVADVLIDGDNVKLYTNLVYCVVDFSTSTVDATDMTNFYFDFWTADPTDLPAIFKVKLVDFGADGAYQGGDDVEHELTFDASTTPSLATGNWITFDIPLADFTNLVTTGHLAQLILSGDPNTVYIDNVLFHN